MKYKNASLVGKGNYFGFYRKYKYLTRIPFNIYESNSSIVMV